MRQRTARILLAFDIVGMLLLVAVLGVSWQAGQNLIHPKRDTSPATPSSLGLAWTWANTTTSDGVPLVGWWVPADATPQDNLTIVFLHGYSDSKAQGLEALPFLHRHGNVYLFDFRASGQSGGDVTTAGAREVRDVRAAVELVNQRLPHPSIALVGWSMGGAAALNFVGTTSSTDLKTLGVAGVVTDGAFSHLTHIVETSISKFTGLPRWPFGPLATTFAGWSIGERLEDNAPAVAVAGYPGPLLLVHGTADTTVTPEQQDEIAAAAPQAQVWKVPGAAHVECLKTDPAGYEAHVGGFLEGLPHPNGVPVA